MNTVVNKFDDVCEFLNKLDSAVIAFSGGFDSTYLAEACMLSLKRTYAIFVDTPLISKRQRSEAERIADSIGIPLKIVKIKWENLLEVTENDEQRCYFCKKIMYSAVKELAEELGINTWICGDNYDDILQHRPGRKAASELGILSPLETLKITRSDVLEHVLSKEWSRNMIKDTCLATRIPTRTVLTQTLLKNIEDWEFLIRKMTGIRQVRFRYFDNSASIQTLQDDIISLEKYMPELNKIASKKGLSLKINPEGYKEI